MLSLLISSLLYSADCSIAFPLKQKDGLKAACVEVEKIYTIGHIRFYSFPKVRTKDDSWPYHYRYFASTLETRNKLCQLLGSKRESKKSHIEDNTLPNIEYSRNGFEIKSQNKTLKVLACRIL